MAQSRFGRGLICAKCEPDVSKFWAQGQLGLIAFPGIRDMLASACANRCTKTSDCSTHVQSMTIIVDKVQVAVACFKSKLRSGTLVYNPLTVTKRNCNLWWACDKRWLHLKTQTMDRSPTEQTALAKKIFLLPFGTRVLPEKRVRENELQVVSNILVGRRTATQSAHMLWTYLTESTLWRRRNQKRSSLHLSSCIF